MCNIIGYGFTVNRNLKSGTTLIKWRHKYVQYN